MAFNPFEFKVNGVTLSRKPTAYQIDFQPISDGERLLDGTMVIEGVAAKHVVTLEFDYISKDELEQLVGVTWEEFRTNRSKLKQTITFPYFDDEPITLNTYFGPFSIRRDRESTSVNAWRDVRISFIEL